MLKVQMLTQLPYSKVLREAPIITDLLSFSLLLLLLLLHPLHVAVVICELKLFQLLLDVAVVTQGLQGIHGLANLMVEPVVLVVKAHLGKEVVFSQGRISRTRTRKNRCKDKEEQAHGQGEGCTRARTRTRISNEIFIEYYSTWAEQSDAVGREETVEAAATLAPSTTSPILIHILE